MTNTLKHDDPEAVNRYRCPDCGRRWGSTWLVALEDACPNCGVISKPLPSKAAVRRYAIMWAFVFVAGWGFGFLSHYALVSEGLMPW
jgi:predicted RNA-binding Zn-ribbon protein involved in translation (DUF1610 family)